ncbi:MAG: hypothetical protein KA761_00190 [Gemmatimonadaceae bacterium]|nr:hypothetical protein [Gemmatimonadaceae bacterium]
MTIATVHTAMRAALRARLTSLVVTSATANLTPSGYTYSRAAGSFVDDGFVVGDHINVTGLASTANGRSRVRKVEAATLTIDRAVSGAQAIGTIVATVPALVAWEATPFVPTVGVPYVAEQMRPIGSAPAAVGSSGIERVEVLYAVNVFGPTGEGPLPAERLAGAIMQWFKPGARLVAGEHEVVVMKVARTAIVPDAAWINVPVQVTAVAYSNR